MPQMAPIGWLTLFIIFSLSFILFSMMNYYSMIPQAPKSKVSESKLNQPMNWKW
uniref:ATP synthase F0 subunit 8 n=1 Tax=Rivellia apicalis TaxID=286529 RepID=UPI0022FD7C83|nr:ATP synthase F0 subunit 8 [Rivellia apicalis]WAR64258.1 ATP synthase F0 subunit 8 [Rivellia apicalis]